jgi:uncharacterized protein YggT (Ycf19 family)
MAERRIEEVEQVSLDGRTQRRVQTVDEPGIAGARRESLATRIIWYITGLILALLALRFVLALLGANQANGFANFVYNVSHPFVAPFFTLFNYNLQYGVSHFETFTLVAMAVYAGIAFALAKLFTINRRHAVQE